MGVSNGGFLSGSGLDLGSPYSRLGRNVRLLENCLGGVFPLIKEDSKTKTAFDSLRWLIREIRRKPNILLLGAFDAGKSTLANVLLGKNYLPADFQPMT